MGLQKPIKDNISVNRRSKKVVFNFGAKGNHISQQNLDHLIFRRLILFFLNKQGVASEFDMAATKVNTAASVIALVVTPNAGQDWHPSQIFARLHNPG